MRRTDDEKTWPNMRQNFTDAHQELRNTDVTVDKLGFHIANAIVAQIVEQLREEVLSDNTNPSPVFQSDPPSDYLPEANSLPRQIPRL